MSFIKRRQMLSKSVVALIFVLGLATWPLNSKASERNWHNRLLQTKISIQEAIAIAEHATAATTFEAELESNSFTLEYEIELAKKDSQLKVMIDAITGEIKRIKTKPLKSNDP